MNTPDIERLRAELAQYAAPPQKQEDDIDAEMLAQILGMAVNAARKQMRKIAANEKDRYKLMQVKVGSNVQWVLRRIPPPQMD